MVAAMSPACCKTPTPLHACMTAASIQCHARPPASVPAVASSRAESHALCTQLQAEDEVLHAPLQPGDISVHNERVMHGSGPNMSKVRLSLMGDGLLKAPAPTCPKCASAERVMDCKRTDA